MTRLLLALLILLLCAPRVSAAEPVNPWISVLVQDGDGAPLANVRMTIDSKEYLAKYTNAQGVEGWSLSANKTACEIRIDGVISSVKASGGTASERAGVVYVAWLKGTALVNVTITANATGTTPTPTLTPTRTYTPWPTATLGPSPTQAATHAPDMNRPNVLIEAAPMVQPGRFTYTWWPNLCDVEVFTADGDALSHDGPTWYSVEASDWIRFYVLPDPDSMPPSPPQIVTVIVTATPGAATATATRTPLPGVTTSVCATIAPTATLTLEKEGWHYLNRYQDETGLYGVVVGVPANSPEIVEAFVRILEILRDAGLLRIGL